MNIKKSVITASIIFILVFTLTSLPVKAETVEEWKIKGNEYLAAEEYDKALECYEKSLAIDPCYGRSILNMGWTYKEMKEYDKGYQIEKAMLSFVNKQDLPVTNRKRELLWEKTEKEIEKFRHDIFEQQVLRIFDFTVWIESRIRKRSLSEVIKAKVSIPEID